MVIVIVLLAVLVAVFIVLFLFLKSTKVPEAAYKNKIIYQDHHKENLARPLFSARYGLVGKPDLILHTKDGQIPLEIKSAKRPKEPYFNHVMQLVSHCLLIEEERGLRPKYGFLQYHGGDAFYIPYTEKEKQFLIKTINDMRGHIDSGTGAGLMHNRRCGYGAHGAVV